MVMAEMDEKSQYTNVLKNNLGCIFHTVVEWLPRKSKVLVQFPVLEMKKKY